MTVFVGCKEEEASYLDEIRVSSSYVSLPADGGSTEITVDAKADWEFTSVPEWLKVEPMSGSAGKELTVKFSAEKAKSTNEAMVYLNCDGKSQIINVIQQTEKVELPISTVAQVIAGEDGTSYRVKGACTAISNTTYGNWILVDETGELTIYGTLDKNGAEKNFLSLGLEAGDIVTVEGPKTTYGSTIELVNVTVVNIEKSLIKVESVTPEDALPKEGGVAEFSLTCKGGNIDVVIPEAAKSWLSVAGMSSNGTAATVKLSAAANEVGDRSAEVTFKTTSAGKEYSVSATVSQKGAIIEATAAQILAAEDGATQYRLTGYITKDSGNDYGNIYVKDATGEIYIYGVLDSKGQSKQWKSMGINAGDIITVVGPKTSFNGKAQMKNVSVESFKSVKDATVAEFTAKEDSKDVYYRLSGTVSGIKDSDLYGNFDLTDESGKVYVYGLLSGWGGEKKKFQELGLKDGDKITLVGCVGSHNGTKQVVNAFFVTKVENEPEQPVAGDADYTITDKNLPKAYPAEETTVALDGVEVYVMNVANISNNIQMKKEGSYIANTTAFGKKIKTIKVTVQDGKSWYPTNLTLLAGTSAKSETATIPAVSDETSSTYDLSAGDYTFFTLKNTSGYAVYLSKIEITLAK